MSGRQQAAATHFAVGGESQTLLSFCLPAGSSNISVAGWAHAALALQNEESRAFGWALPHAPLAAGCCGVVASAACFTQCPGGPLNEAACLPASQPGCCAAITAARTYMSAPTSNPVCKGRGLRFAADIIHSFSVHRHFDNRHSSCYTYLYSMLHSFKRKFAADKHSVAMHRTCAGSRGYPHQ